MSDGPVSQATPVRPEPTISPRTLPFEPHSLPSLQPDRFVAPTIEPEIRRRPLPVRGLAMTLVSVIIAGIALGVAIVYFYNPAPDPDVVVKPSSAASEVVGLESPRAVVEEYFKALQDGNIARALELGTPGGSGSDALLTDVAYGRTREIAPISNVEVLTGDDGTTEVEVRYTLGDEQITSTVPVVRLDNGTYRMAHTTVPVRFDVAAAQRVPLQINGTNFTPSQNVELVPGRYRLSTGLPFLEYPATNDFTVGSLSRSAERLTPVTPQLTDAGRKAFMEAAEDSLTRCLDSKSLAPKGCPFQIASKAPIDNSSISWTLVNDPWSRATATLSNKDLSVAQIRVTLQISVYFRYADGTASGNNPVKVTALATARMLGSQSDQLSISWSS